MDVSRFKISKTDDDGLRNGQAPSKLNDDSGEFSYVFFFLLSWAGLWSVTNYNKLIRICLLKSLPVQFKHYWQTSYLKLMSSNKKITHFCLSKILHSFSRNPVIFDWGWMMLHVWHSSKAEIFSYFWKT